MTLRDIFRKNLKIYRKKLSLSQMKLAEACQTSTSYIGEIEIGKKFPSIEMIETIAKNLKIEPYKLFIPEESKTVKELSDGQKNYLKNEFNKIIDEIVNSLD